MRLAPAIVALILLMGAPAAGTGAVSGGGDIVFVSDRRGAANLYVVEPDGSALRELTTGAAAVVEAAVSGDGDRVAFVRGGEAGEIWLSGLDGADPRRLSGGGDSGDAHPEWSPDGRQVAFVRVDVDTGANLVMVADAQTGRHRVMTRKRALLHPSWSPDGERLAFTDESALTDDALPCGLVTVRADGSGLRDVPTPERLCAMEPDWSPDGSRLVFVGARSIYVVRPDGSGLRRIVRMGGRELSAPAWSPDGRRIAFAALDVRGDRDGIYVVAANGGEARHVVGRNAAGPTWISSRELAFIRNANLWRTDLSHPARRLTLHVEAADPAWAPDGGAVAYAASTSAAPWQNSRWRLRTMAPDGRSSSLGIIGQAPAWDPRGKLAYERRGWLWTATRGGRDERRLAYGWSPAWSPDGALLAFNVLALRVLSVRPRRERMLTPETTQPRTDAEWAPDGLRIAYTRFTANDFGEDSAPNVYVVHRDGTRRHVLIRNASDPAWSPDGTRIAFVRDGDIWVRRLGDGRESKIVGGPYEEYSPDWGRGDAF